MMLRRIPAVLAACLALLGGVEAFAKQIHSERSLYRNIFVVENDDLRCLSFRRSVSGARQTCTKIDEPKYLVFPYTRMVLGAVLLKPNPSRILVIGLGGGTLPMALRDLYPAAEIDVVEIDPAVTRVAEKFFGFQRDSKMQVFEEDGRVFVKRALRREARYDIVMLDAFEDEYIPEHLSTREFLTEVKGLLTADGVVAANTFSGNTLYPYESATYADVFGDFYNLKLGNRVIWAQPGGLVGIEALRANAKQFEAFFDARGFSADWLLAIASTRRDWPADTRLLTDQYSPSNILNAR